MCDDVITMTFTRFSSLDIFYQERKQIHRLIRFGVLFLIKIDQYMNFVHNVVYDYVVYK